MVDWLPWSAETFARARRERKPVLLSITAAWCHACHEMDRTTYADPHVVAAIRDRVVPIRVDRVRRPDVKERYNLGGWPTPAVLTAEGALVTGGTFVPADRMVGVLARVVEAFQTSAFESDAASDAAPSTIGDTATVPNPDVDALVESIFSTFDDEHGGFGIEPKFPHTAPLHVAMRLFRQTESERWRLIVERTLDAMWNGGLRDPERGGFYRYATSRDWQLPHYEKLLDTNAALLRAYAEAAAVFGRPCDRDRSGAIAAFLTTVLRAEGGGFYGCDVDRVLYADANAAVAGALLESGACLGDSALVQEALASFERVVLACYKPGRGVAHCFDGTVSVRGLLADQVATIGALLDAHDATEGEPYQMMAEELGHFVVREMWDAEGGGFFDRSGTADDIGLLRTRRKPFVANAEAAQALARLDRIAHEFDFHPYALGALRTAAQQVKGQGPLAAHYLLAWQRVNLSTR
jgi:uncharacterized protein YyaL (SSP411 family)